MQATVTWQDNLTFTCTNEKGLNTTMDGSGDGISPMESVLMAAGACSSVDVVEILKKGRFELLGCECKLSAERAADAPRIFTKIHAHYAVRGEGLTDKAVARAVQLSAEKYCSVMLMLSPGVDITTDYSIND